jgi:hypothetical protein
MKTINHLDLYRKDLEEAFSSYKSIVFLCGPSLKDDTKDGVKLRKKIKDELEKEGFEVVLGEDDGLEELRKKYSMYAHENELKFVEQYCHSVIIVASSVGSFCELGLFSYKKVNDFHDNIDFVLIIHQEYKSDTSYLNEGPAAAIRDFGGVVYYGDLENFDCTEIIMRLKRRRAIFSDRPKKRKKN